MDGAEVRKKVAAVIFQFAVIGEIMLMVAVAVVEFVTPS